MPQRLIYIWKATLVLMALSLVATSSGCQRKSHSPTPTPAIQQRAIEEGNVLITFAAPAGQRSLYEALINAFNQEHADIRVQFVPLENSTNLQKQASSADASILSGPDIFAGGAYFTDLQPLIDADPTFQQDDFWPGLLSASQDSQGRMECIPLTAGIHGIYYDKQAFTAANIPEPKPGWTWNEFRNDIRTLASSQGDTIQYGFADGNTPYTSLLNPLVDAYLSDNDGKLDTVALQAIIQWYLDLVEAKTLYPMQDASIGGQALDGLFQPKTRPVMWTGYLATPLPGSGGSSSGSATWSELAVANEGFAPFPVDENNTNTTPAFASCAAISAGSRHPQAAWEWINYLSRQWVTMPEAGVYGIAQAPARQSVAETADYWSKLPENVVPTVRFGLEHAWLGPKYSGEIGIVNAALVELFMGKVDFVNAFADSQQAENTNLETTPAVTAITVATPQPTIAPEEATAVYFIDLGFSEKERNAIKKLADEFNRIHPEMAIEYTSYGVEGIFSYQSLVDRADCFTASIPPGNEDTNILLSLDSFISAENPAFLGDFSPTFLDTFRLGGELYGLPTAIYPPIMFYNTNLLAKRGLQAPANDWSFDDFIELATIASSDESDKTYGYYNLPGTYSFFFAGRGAQWLNFNTNPPVATIDSTDMVSALTWMVELSKSGVFLFDNGNGDAWSLMGAGKIALMQWFYLPSDFSWGNSFTFGVPVPIMGYKPIDNIAPIAIQAISKTAKNPRACWEWLKFLSEQPNAFSGVPVRQSVAASPSWETLVGKEKAEVYRLAVSRIIPYYELPVWQYTMYTSIYFWLHGAVDACIHKGEDPLQSLTIVQEKAEAYLACMVEVDYENMKTKELSDKSTDCYWKADAINR